jgi:integrase
MTKSVEIIPNKLRLETVKDSPYWRMRWKNPDGDWRAKSTKIELSNEEDAKAFALEEFSTEKLLAKHGHNVSITKTVEDVALMYLKTLRPKREDGRETSDDASRRITENWIIPVIGHTPIDKVTSDLIASVNVKREERLGRELSKSSINKQNIVLRAIFEIAKNKKYVTLDDMPSLTMKKKGAEVKRRSGFTLQEYVHLRRFLRDYHIGSRSYVTKYKRQVLREYVIFLLGTGLRPGIEPLTLCWKNIDESFKSRHIAVYVQDGKTKKRTCIARPIVASALRRLKSLTNQVEPDDYVFCMPDGSQLKDMSSMVNRMLSDAGLRYDQEGQKRSAYSFRHTYATFMVEYKKGRFEVLEKSMGNSVAMLSKFYSDTDPLLMADELSGFKQRSSVEKNIDKLLAKGTDDQRKIVHENVFARWMKTHGVPPHTPEQQAEFDEEVRYWLEDAQSELEQGRV